ncbi:MAG: hypothetical protein JW701_06050, partial [Kosmotogaceae bacterium]|nr:hypothetical protein [Kosmotogaceae bacterium]
MSMLIEELVNEGMELISLDASRLREEESRKQQEYEEKVENLLSKLANSLGITIADLAVMQAQYVNSGGVRLVIFGQFFEVSEQMIMTYEDGMMRQLLAISTAKAKQQYDKVKSDVIQLLNTDSKDNYLEAKDKCKKIDALWEDNEIVALRSAFLKRRMPSGGGANPGWYWYSHWLRYATELKAILQPEIEEVERRREIEARKESILLAIQSRRFAIERDSYDYDPYPTWEEIQQYEALLGDIPEWPGYTEGIEKLRIEARKHESFKEREERRMQAQAEAFKPFAYYKVFFGIVVEGELDLVDMDYFNTY